LNIENDLLKLCVSAVVGNSTQLLLKPFYINQLKE